MLSMQPRGTVVAWVSRVAEALFIRRKNTSCVCGNPTVATEVSKSPSPSSVESFCSGSMQLAYQGRDDRQTKAARGHCLQVVTAGVWAWLTGVESSALLESVCVGRRRCINMPGNGAEIFQTLSRLRLARSE